MRLTSLTSSQITKVPLIGPGCSQLTSCTSCLLSSKVTECGWCDGRCTRASQCPASSGWTQDYCTPVITKVTMATAGAAGSSAIGQFVAAAAPPHCITATCVFRPIVGWGLFSILAVFTVAPPLSDNGILKS